MNIPFALPFRYLSVIHRTKEKDAVLGRLIRLRNDLQSARTQKLGHSITALVRLVSLRQGYGNAIKTDKALKQNENTKFRQLWY